MPNKSPSFCVYCKDVEINDATFRYLDVIRGGLSDAGLVDLGITQDRQVLRQATVVVTISCLPAMRALLLHPRAKLVHWFQGIEAVERRFLHKGWRGWSRWLLWSLMERRLLARANLKLFVSEQMRAFLKDTDRPDRRSLVIPCYNVDLGDIEASPPSRYRQINMVYAGSLYPWQCVEQSIAVYGAVRKARPDATMTIFTREIDKARSMCAAMGAPEISIEEVSPSRLVERLREFSFGFILREKLNINEVSTPTKFSSYLGAGVIPIMTRATPALASMAANTPFHVMADSPSCTEALAKQVVDICQNAPHPSDVARSFSEIFDSYFDDNKNRLLIAGLAEKL